MSQSLTQHSALVTLEEKFQQVADFLRKVPMSAWRALVIAIAAVWLVRTAASLFWLIFPLPNVAQPTQLAAPAQAQGAVPTKTVSFDDVASLSGAFGTVTEIDPSQLAQTQTQEEDVPEEASVTKLNLKLHGVFASNDPVLGSAIIADGNEQALYAVEDELKGQRGVKLAKVLEKYVILDNNGRFESLWLFSEDDFKSQGIAQNRRAVPKRTRPRVAPMPQNAIRTSARPEQLPKNIGDVVRFSVHREEGRMVGYRIRPGRDRELFNQVGLKANDIVTTVNGIEVNDPKQIRNVYQSMKTATEAQLTVLRDGQTHSITISLDSDA